MFEYSQQVKRRKWLVLLEQLGKVDCQRGQFLLYQYFIQSMAFVPNIKYKTEYCLYWQQGTTCEKGAQCFFAHGENELRTIEENHQEIMMRQTEKVSQQGKPNNYKTIFCKFYAEGQCKLGDKCTYAHQRRERRKKKHSQEYQADNCHQPNWSQQQINQYYQQMYYYQMYQVPLQHFNYLNQPFQENTPDLQQQMMLKETPPQEATIEDGSRYEEKQIRSTKDSSEMAKQEKVPNETPSTKNKVQSPGSNETEGVTNSTLTNLDMLDHSSEFKTEL